MHISPTSNHMNGFATSQTGQHKVSVVPHFGKQHKIDTAIYTFHTLYRALAGSLDPRFIRYIRPWTFEVRTHMYPHWVVGSDLPFCTWDFWCKNGVGPIHFINTFWLDTPFIWIKWKSNLMPFKQGGWGYAPPYEWGMLCFYGVPTPQWRVPPT